MEINSLESSISRLYESFAVEENRSWFDCKAVGARVNKMVFELGSKDGDTFNPRLSRKKKAKKKLFIYHHHHHHYHQKEMSLLVLNAY